MNINDHPVYQAYQKLREDQYLFDKVSLPLCASENIISPFCRLPLQDMTHEKYLLGGTREFAQAGNFIGGDILFQIYNLINKQIKTLFGCKYADARTLSGLNCITSILMALTKIGDTIILSSIDSGGHSSVVKIAERLGLKIIEAPYDFIEYDYNYEQLNKIVREHKVKLILLSPSNIIYPPKLNNIDTTNVLLIYDASQTLGMIASGILDNPLRYGENIILIGSTHKTLPGPACGLILTNNMNVANIIDGRINPIYVSITQLQYKIVLLHTLIELELCGKAYGEKIQSNVKYLSEKFVGSSLFQLVGSVGKYSQTHQILLGINNDIYNNLKKNAINHSVTLNLSSNKRNNLFQRECGLRLGLQEISRYNWGTPELDSIRVIFDYLAMTNPPTKLGELLRSLSHKKEIHFTITPLYKI